MLALTNFHLPPAYAYPHLLLQEQQQENMLYREKTPTKSTWTFPVNVLKLNTHGSSKGNSAPTFDSYLLQRYCLHLSLIALPFSSIDEQFSPAVV
ncbi:unnamed protein product [Lactuca virosa]|uniref:Uncharacterized protein n=1 Tax=Lactuca virosa TaxID=75947 RepID=A0AAU9MEL9_9ASTR|nr:unnamed protein product [Lactuca virosa]